VTWFLTNMAWASLAMLLVLAVRRPFAAAFGAGPVYALWLLPALRLVAPPLPAWGVELPNLLPPQTLILFAEDAAAPLPPDGGPGQWVPISLAIWALGAAAFLAWQALAYRRFVAELNTCARDIGGHRGLRLIESPAVQGPLALGLLRRRICIPADFASRYSPEERALALDHEAIHHRRGDLWWNHLGLLILALNWFNPIAWFAFKAFRADQELACDAAVAAAAPAQARHDYARALIKSASRPGLIAACPLNHADQLKRRLKMMKFHKASRLRMIGGSAAIVLLGGLSLAVGSPGLAHPQAETPKQDEAAPGRERREERVIVRTIRPDGATGGQHGAHGGHAAPSGSDDHQRVIVMTHRGDGHPGPGQHRVRVIGPDGELSVPECNDGQATNVDETQGGQRTRIVLCSRGNATPAERAERLQRARDRLAGDSELSQAQRDHVTAALDREIARLRGN
jgi:beta-lactamase regulating signal transducer with metallopeptidase domain